MSAFKGDFLGFTYNKKHSSTFGMVRTSDGSRFNENLRPTMQDKTVQVPGGDGTYYFGSYYTQRQFNISFAFDAMTEKQLADFKQHFGSKEICELIFDETPYKIYRAKVTGSATIKYLVFDEGDTHRVYKGEGSIQFTCFDPFARCKSTNPEDYGLTKVELDESTYEKNKYYCYDSGTFKFILDNRKFNQSRNYYLKNDQSALIVQQMNEWWEASRIEKNKNFGDVPTSFKVKISGKGKIKFEEEEVGWDLPKETTATLDTKLGIAKGEDGKIYNQYLTGNSALKIPVGAKTTASGENYSNLTYDCYYF